jgi:hypothetical protein
VGKGKAIPVFFYPLFFVSGLLGTLWLGGERERESERGRQGGRELIRNETALGHVAAVARARPVRSIPERERASEPLCKGRDRVVCVCLSVCLPAWLPVCMSLSLPLSPSI